MTRHIIRTAAVAAALLAAGCSGGQEPVTEPAAAPAPPTEAELVQRGQYLVTAIGGCNDCHSPLDPMGAPVPGKELTGAQLPFAPTVQMPWAPVAPPIRGLPPTWTAGQLAGFLQTGVRPDGSRALPPMPQYRLNTEDAQAVAAYVGSLK